MPGTETIAKLQLATRQGSYEKFKDWAKIVDEKESPIFIRDFFGFKKAAAPTPIDEVEPVESIVKHFVTGAMSFGALSIEAHEALALAMNKPWSPLEHRRGRRGQCPLSYGGGWREPEFEDQADSLGTFRCDSRISSECRGDTNQGGTGSQAWRGWTVARFQGERHHCQDAQCHSRHLAHFAATPPRYL